MSKVDTLKELAVKCTTATKASDVPGRTVDEVLQYIVDNFSVTASSTNPTEGGS